MLLRRVGDLFHPKIDLIWIGTAALLTHLLFVSLLLEFLPPSLSGNQSVDYFTEYLPAARSLLAGQGLKNATGAVAITYPPGYSLLLAGVFWLGGHAGLSEEQALRVFYALVGIPVAMLVFSIGQLVFGRRVGWWAALLWVAYPLQLWLSKEPTTEPPFLVIFLSLIYLTLRAVQTRPRLWRAFGIGACVGAASLIRPAALLLSVPLAGFLAGSWKGSRPRARLLVCACLVLGNLAAVTPWEIWASRQAGRVVPLCTLGPTAIRDGLALEVDSSESQQVLPFSEDVKVLLKKFSHFEPNQALPSTREIAEFMLGELRAHPAPVLKLFALKTARTWYATDSQKHELVVALLQLPYLLVAMFGLIRAWSSGSLARSFAVLTTGTVLYFWMMAVVALSIARYMVPSMSLILIFTALGMDGTLAAVQRQLAPARS